VVRNRIPEDQIVDVLVAEARRLAEEKAKETADLGA
jgi:hypothetical protein